MFGKSTPFGRKSIRRSKAARARRRILTIEGLEDRRLLAGLVADGSQIWHHGISEIPNGSIAPIGGAAEAGDAFGRSFATGDFNGDGFADVAIGAFGEDIGTVANAGAVNVIYGSTSGLTGGAGNTRTQLWYQGVAGVDDVSEVDDRFGFALAAGDFNGDNYQDLAIGVPFEDDGAGAVQILLGSESGLTATGGRQILSTDAQVGVSGEFGYALAAGRFGNSDTDQLVIGVPHHEVLIATGPTLPDLVMGDAGSVAVVRFHQGSLDIAAVEIWNQHSEGIKGDSDPDDRFGFSLAVGDFNGDGFDDLAVGVPFETEEVVFSLSDVWSTGAVNVIYGSESGLTSANDQFWWQDTDGVPGENGSFDYYGWELAAGDFDGDGFDDLAVGVPWEDHGWVNIIYGASQGLSDANHDFDQDSPGIVDVAEATDHFGASLTTADFNADGYDDLAIGVPLEHLNANYDGVFHVIYGSTDGLKAVNPAPGSAPQMFSAEDLSGFTFDFMEFGRALAAADFDADGHADLMIGMPGLGGGKAYAMFGNATGLTDAAGGHQYWHQNIPGSTSSLENGAHFGKQLATGDFNGDGRDDLAIGVPGRDLPREHRWEKFSAGVVNVLYGDQAGTFATEQPPQILHQDMLDDPKPVLRGATSFEGFGSTLSVGDFNADGFDDLVVGTPFETVDGRANAGAIHIIFGTPVGLDSTTSVMIYQGILGLGAVPMTGDQFGAALATGDFDLDGIDDIAVGVPYKDVLGRVEAGMVHLLYGSPVTIDGQTNSDFRAVGIGSSDPAPGDRFGWSLAVGDSVGINTADDLAVGIPGFDVGNATDAGAVAIYAGIPEDGINSTAAPIVIVEDQLSDVSEADDNFGHSLAMGDFDRDGFDDLVIGTPLEDLEHDNNGLQVDAGAVTVVPGSASGLNTDAHQFWHQDLDDPSPTQALGVASTGKHFGDAIAVGDFNADQHDDLAVGVPNEAIRTSSFQFQAGRVNVIHSTQNGLDEVEQQLWHQSIPGIADSAGLEDHFGSVLATGDFNGDGADDLAVGVPDEDIDGFSDAGIVHTILGSPGVIFNAPGDFDLDGELTCDDIDMLTAEAAGGANNIAFDLTGDGLVNVDDVEHWVTQLKVTLLGDANLDGVVDGFDFLIWNDNKFTATPAWCSGDFSADGTVDGFDFLIWNANKFQSAAPLMMNPNGQPDAMTERDGHVDEDFAAHAPEVATVVVTPERLEWVGSEDHSAAARPIAAQVVEIPPSLKPELIECTSGAGPILSGTALAAGFDRENAIGFTGG